MRRHGEAHRSAADVSGGPRRRPTGHHRRPAGFYGARDGDPRSNAVPGSTPAADISARSPPAQHRPGPPAPHLRAGSPRRSGSPPRAPRSSTSTTPSGSRFSASSAASHVVCRLVGLSSFAGSQNAPWGDGRRKRFGGTRLIERACQLRAGRHCLARFHPSGLLCTITFPVG